MLWIRVHLAIFFYLLIIFTSAFEIYADPKSEERTTTRVGSLQTEQEGLTSRAERFKKAFSYKDVKVHFVGAW